MKPSLYPPAAATPVPYRLRPSAPAPPRPAAPAPAARPLATPGSPKPAADLGPPSPLAALRGKVVRLGLVDGSVIEGPLAEVARYELLLVTNPGVPGPSRTRVVCKAAVLWAEEVGP